MPFTTLSAGLTLTIPTNGTTSWGTTVFNTTWTKISNHRHQGAGDGNQIPTAGIVDNAITKAKLSLNLALNVAATLTPSGTTQTVNFSLGNNQKIDLSSATGTVVLTLSNPIAGAWYTILLAQGATFRDLTWPAAVKWPQAQAPILSTTASAVDMVQLYYDGTDYKGIWELNFS